MIEVKYRDLMYPIANDPFLMVAEAFSTLFPDKRYFAYVVQDYEKSFGESYGCTIFPDGDYYPRLYLNADTSYVDLVEVFAHELAHVAAGADNEHGEAWESAFEAIYNEYNKILLEEEMETIR